MEQLLLFDPQADPEQEVQLDDFLAQLWYHVVDMEARAQGRDPNEVERELAKVGVSVEIDGQTVTLKPDAE